MEPQFFDRFFRENAPPPEVDLQALRREWLALRPPYRPADRRLPRPLWARRPFTDSGEQAWQTLCRDLPGLDPARAMSIYVHIPFCAERCEFCDCYAFRLGAHRDRHVGRYLDLLAQEARLWSQQGKLAEQPVSTVHFGGGTPTFFRAAEFSRLVRALRQSFAAGPATEWALESSASELTSERLGQLADLGFSRLHVGVQSLHDDVRRAIGRRAKGTAVLWTLAEAIERGWIVSVDLIYGLPGQTLDSLARGIRALVAVGVEGFSLYELQVSGRNRRFAQKHGLDHRERRVDYLLGQVAAHLLQAQGYAKTLFNHFAAGRDANLYFSFPARGEDCLALGTVADGRFGDYHYRHPEYAAYCRSLSERFPALEGGLRRTPLENRLEPLTVALMAARVPPSLFDGVIMIPASPPERGWPAQAKISPARAGSQSGAQARTVVRAEQEFIFDGATLEGLLRRWRAMLLLQEEARSGDLLLTGSGSWFVGNMISELFAQVKSAAGGEG